MRLAKRSLLLTACLIVGLAVAGAANAVSLLDLVGGASFVAGGVTYSDFAAKIKGKSLSQDLGDYEITPTADGFTLTGDFSQSSKGGKIKLSYLATGTDLVGVGLAIDGGTGTDGKLKAKKKISDGGKKVAKLSADLKNGDTTDTAPLDSLAAVSVVEDIKIKGDYFLAGSGASVGNSFAHTPEPTTALMLAAGLAGLAAAGRKRTS